MANATKHALAGALLELLNTTTLDNITVKDIVERAQVSRRTAAELGVWLGLSPRGLVQFWIVSSVSMR